jgi:hypothetical protein
MDERSKFESCLTDDKNSLYVVRNESAGIQFDPAIDRFTSLKPSQYTSHGRTAAKYSDIVDFKEER